MKKFPLPFQNMIRADLFSGSLAVWNALGFAFYFARPPIPSRAQRGEERTPFELFQEYTAKIRNSNFRQKYGRREAPSVLHSPHKILILQGFATLRAAPRLPIQNYDLSHQKGFFIHSQIYPYK